MRAPVYRNIDAKNSVLGLAFPTEVLAVMTVFWGTILTLPPSIAAGVTAAVYVAVRLVNYGRAPAFVQHWLAWRLRRVLGGGRLTAAARAPAPRFPFEDSCWRSGG